MPFKSARLKITKKQRGQLAAITRKQTAPAAEVVRAKIVLGLGEKKPYRVLGSELGVSSATIALWRNRFEDYGVAGLISVHPGKAPSKLTAAVRAKVLARTQQAPPDGSTHWSCRKMAEALNLSKTLVHRIWQESDLKPHRLDRYMASNDPDFEKKAADIIGLYLHPPQHAAVFSVDEKSAIQALDRKDPCLPLSPGRAERHGFEYFRHGTLSLYAALDIRTGQVIGKTAARHTSAEFVDFLRQVAGSCPANQEIHVIVDNLSAHKTQLVRSFLAEQPRLQLHYTPTYSSWLNQVEIWFSKIERDVIARGVFTSVNDLTRKIMRYIRLYAKRAQPIRWKYADATKRIRA
jgi:transposase